MNGSPFVTQEGMPIEENIRIAEEAIRQRAECDREALLRNADREKQREKEVTYPALPLPDSVGF